MAGGKQHEGSSSKENNTWLSRVQKRFESEDYIKSKPSSSNVCIYRVPELLIRDKPNARVPELLIRGKPEAYRPEFVSFGPFHHNKHQGAMEDHKLEAEDHKLEALHKTEQRLNDQSKSIKDLIAQVKMLDNEIRECYVGQATEYDEETLAWMMTMDGCFILEFLRAVYANNKVPESGFSLIFNSGEVDNIIQCGILNDIFKLENQIPIFILTTILEFEFSTSHDDAEVKLTEILHKCLQFHYYPFKTDKNDTEMLNKYKSYLSSSGRACHLLGVCRNAIEDFLIQTPETTDESSPEKCVLSLFKNACCGLLRGQKEDSYSHVYEMPRAELLNNAGIQFKACVEGHLRFEKRRLGSSTLFLPRIVIEENKTETKLRNLIIFEECEKTKGKDNVISNYISFMNRLIDSEKDVALLTKEGIIINWLGSDEEVAAIFNNLDKEALVGETTQFSNVAKNVKAEYNRKLKVLMSQFIEEHCSKPWYVVSLVAAMLILVMTAIQAVYSVKK